MVLLRFRQSCRNLVKMYAGLADGNGLLPFLGGSCYKYNFFVSKHVFVATNVLLRQAYICRDKRRVLSRQTRVCRDKRVFVATKLLSRQNIILVAAPGSDTGVVLTGWL